MKYVILKRVVDNGSEFDRFFGNISEEETKAAIEKRGYSLRVAVAGYRVTPRDGTFEYFREMGLPYLESVLHHKPIGMEKLTFYFPERSLSVHEQHMFIPCLDTHPEVKSKKLVSVDMITQNALIVGGLGKGEVVKFDTASSRGLLETELQEIIDGEVTAEQLYERIAREME